MSYTPIDPYRRAPRPSLSASEAEWLERELRKIEEAIRALHVAIAELRAKVP